ncbi:MAG: DNA mismatch repair endonuclease MutL [Methanomicrobiales archaeon]
MAEPQSHRIRLLDQATVNQIAAGEVVERPASVVKELVENSIDAGATRITVLLESGREGITSVRITDNGCGMGAEDACISFTPHATSKITSIGDLDRCRTLGFRGEALASIAAVSHVILVTMERDGGESATEVIIRGGDIEKVTETGAPAGTSITVRDLFFNTPARKKFQKSVGSEVAAITRVMEAFAVANPGIAFLFSSNGNERVSTEGSGDLFDTIVALYGSGVAEELIPVSITEGPLNLGGYISKPSLSRQNIYQVFVSINNRQVYARAVVDAVRAGYGTLLPDNRYPVAFLDLGLDPSYIDVNVHPAKRIVHISRERDICAMVTGAVSRALKGADLVPRVPGGFHSIRKSGPSGSVSQGYDHRARSAPVVAEAGHGAVLLSDRRLRQSELSPGTTSSGDGVPEFTYLGQYAGAYIIAQAPFGELLLIDQHAAHERVLYEQVTAFRDLGQEAQELLVPTILTLSPAESGILREYLPLLMEKGFSLEEFGKDTYAVRMVPVILGKPGDGEMVRDIIGDLISLPRKHGADSGEQLARTIACHGAVKAGNVLTSGQCQRLLDQLSRTNEPWTCPHGRPVMISFTRERLDVLFKRT